MADKPDYLVCSRASAEFCARGSTFDHFCSKCGERVMLAPSSVSLLKEQPSLPIICYPCMIEIVLARGESAVRLAPNTGQVKEEIRTAIRNPWRGRN